MKIRLLVFCLAAILEPTFVYANIDDCNFIGPFEGWYGGINAGNTQYQTDNDVNIMGNFSLPISSTFDTANGLFNTSYSGNEYKNLLNGGINLGFGYNFPHSFFSQAQFHIGIEGFKNFFPDSNIKSNFLTNFTNVDAEIPGQGNSVNFFTATKTRINSEYGIDLKPGFAFLNGTLLYGRIGASFNEIKVDSVNSAFITTLLPNVITFTLLNRERLSTLQFNKNQNTGLRLGAGVEKYITPQISLHADYIYTNYGKLKLKGAADAQGFGEGIIVDSAIFLPLVVTPNGYTNHSNVDVVTQTFLLGINYYLDCYLPPAALNSIHQQHFNGVYVGLRGGEMQMHANDFTSTTSINTRAFFGGAPGGGSITQFQSNTTKLFENLFTGSIFLGYGKFLESTPIYIGIEGYYNPFSSDQKFNQISHAIYDYLETDGELVTTTLQTRNRISTSSELGEDLRLGFLLDCNTLLYGRIGLAYNKLELTSASIFNMISFDAPSGSTNISNSSLSGFKEEKMFGTRVGGGLEEYLGENLSVSVDYIYTNYGRLSVNEVGPANGINVINTPFVTPNGFVKHTQVDVSSQQVTAGIIFHIPENVWG